MACMHRRLPRQLQKLEGVSLADAMMLSNNSKTLTVLPPPLQELPLLTMLLPRPAYKPG